MPRDFYPCSWTVYRYKIIKYLKCIPLISLAGQIFAKFHVVFCQRELKICFKDHASVTKIAGIPIDIETHLHVDM